MKLSLHTLRDSVINSKGFFCFETLTIASNNFVVIHIYWFCVYIFWTGQYETQRLLVWLMA